MRKAVNNLNFVGSFGAALPELGLPEVAFAGRSNVGKSSLLNRILNRKRAARVSSTPGRTQSINLFEVGGAVVFADLPGYGYAKVPGHVQDAWKEHIERYLSERRALVLVVVLVDCRRDPQPMDGQLIDGLDQAQIPFVVVATKVDKLRKQQRQKKLAALKRTFGVSAIPFSAVTGEGRDAVWDAIEAACGESG